MKKAKTEKEAVTNFKEFYERLTSLLHETYESLPDDQDYHMFLMTPREIEYAKVRGTEYDINNMLPILNDVYYIALASRKNIRGISLV